MRESVQIRSYFCFVFSHIWTEYGPEITPYLDTFHAVNNTGIRPKKLSFTEKFGIIMPSLDTYFLEANAHTESRHQKLFYREKPLRLSLGIFKLYSKVEKRTSTTKPNYIFFIILEHSYFLHKKYAFYTYFSGYL